MLVINVLLFGPLGLTIWAVQMAWIPIWAAAWSMASATTGAIATTTASMQHQHFTVGHPHRRRRTAQQSPRVRDSAKLSSKWYEFDIGWMYIRILEILGLAKAKKTIPQPRFEARNVVDTQTLEAIITHRYDVMTRYMKSLRSIYAEEIEKLRTSNAALADGDRYHRFKRWLSRGENAQPTSYDAEMESVLAHSSRLETVHTMRHELIALWARSTASSEQLLKQLQDWCARAESSGIKQVAGFFDAAEDLRGLTYFPQSQRAGSVKLHFQPCFFARGFGFKPGRAHIRGMQADARSVDHEPAHRQCVDGQRQIPFDKESD
jgi:stearoyl-CoA desaturase (delta-9 desaturase)